MESSKKIPPNMALGTGESPVSPLHLAVCDAEVYVLNVWVIYGNSNC